MGLLANLGLENEGEKWERTRCEIRSDWAAAPPLPPKKVRSLAARQTLVTMRIYSRNFIKNVSNVIGASSWRFRFSHFCFSTLRITLFLLGYHLHYHPIHLIPHTMHQHQHQQSLFPVSSRASGSDFPSAARYACHNSITFGRTTEFPGFVARRNLRYTRL